MICVAETINKWTGILQGFLRTYALPNKMYANLTSETRITNEKVYYPKFGIG